MHSPMPPCDFFGTVQCILVKDVLMGIPKGDLVGMTVAVLQTVGYKKPLFIENAGGLNISHIPD